MYPNTSLYRHFIFAMLFATTWTLLGCRPPHDAERAFVRFRQYVQLQKNDQAWEMLTQQSRKKVQEALKKHGSQKAAKDFFAKAFLFKGLRLRPHPTQPLKQTKESATLRFVDALGQTQTVSMRKEQGVWKLELLGQWTYPTAAPTSQPHSSSVSRPLSSSRPTPSRLPSTTHP